jgi:hypothetical protein
MDHLCEDVGNYGKDGFLGRAAMSCQLSAS